jgi:anthranilate phosphoribosyltransferase
MSQNSASPLEPFDFPAVIRKAAAGEHLTGFEAEFAFDVVMEGEASPVQMAALLTALRVKGIAPSEIAGGVRALRKAMIPIASASPDALIDTCGTGGGDVTTFNISTAAALVARGAGARIAKHGNRSFSSRSGSADVLEALDVRIELGPEEMARVLEEAGVVFMFAPLLHPAMRHVGPVRRELGFSTIMNVLGPLTNPAGVRRQLVGVADPALVPLVVEALKELGHLRALVVHGEAGLDELSPMGPTAVAELRDGAVTHSTVRPEDFGLESCSAEELAGGEPEDNAAMILRILAGEEQGGARTAVVMNAGAAIYVAGISESLEEGIAAAADAIDDGSAMEALEGLRKATEASTSG